MKQELKASIVVEQQHSVLPLRERPVDLCIWFNVVSGLIVSSPQRPCSPPPSSSSCYPVSPPPIDTAHTPVPHSYAQYTGAIPQSCVDTCTTYTNIVGECDTAAPTADCTRICAVCLFARVNTHTHAARQLRPDCNVHRVPLRSGQHRPGGHQRRGHAVRCWVWSRRVACAPAAKRHWHWHRRRQPVRRSGDQYAGGSAESVCLGEVRGGRARCTSATEHGHPWSDGRCLRGS